VLMARAGQRVIADVQQALYARLMRADLAYFHARPSGTLISRFTNDTALLRNAAANVLGGIGKDAVTVVFLVALMFYQDWVLALVAFVAFPLAIHPIVGIGRRMRRVSADTQAEIGQLTTLLSQTFQGARIVKAYGMEAYEEGRAAGLFERLYRLVNRANRARARASPMMESLGGVAIAIVILYGGHQVIAGARTPGAFFSFITALLLAYQPLKSLANLNASLQEGLAAAERVFEVLDVEPGIRDRPGAMPLEVAGGEIRFEGVRFGYAPGAVALDGISFTVPAGDTVALVGPSGAGKSTVLNLIPRFYDVEDGSIAIDGEDVRAVTLASLRAAIALVAQEVTLFDDTVRANIAYGRWGATDAEIEVAARAAGAEAFIRELPQGYDTPVGEHGVRLSGGQRQRLSIARAMLKERAPGAGGARDPDARAHDPRHRASPVDGAARRSDPCARSRADRRERPARRVARPRRRLCPSPCAAVRRGARPRGRRCPIREAWPSSRPSPSSGGVCCAATGCAGCCAGASATTSASCSRPIAGRSRVAMPHSGCAPRAAPSSSPSGTGGC
jgi:subfamily B ATP-binding cassette protein MsbA